MEVEEYENLTVKKKYERTTNLRNVPNTNFLKSNNTRKSYATISGTIKPVKPSIDLKMAKEKLNLAKGKIAPNARYNVT